MRPLPPITIRRQTDDEVRAEVEAWKHAHPGYDESNWVDTFRDDEGHLVEDDDFLDACQLFVKVSSS